MQEFKGVVEHFETDPINFTYITAADPGFGLRGSHFQNYTAVLLKPKKQKWLAIGAANQATMREALEDALSGNGKWQKYEPLFAPKLLTIDEL